jgi:uncharacterized membrane protein
MVRILRVLRVFRIFRLGKRLQNEIQMRLLTLIFTLLAIIVTSAGLFYEVSRRHTAGACVELLHASSAASTCAAAFSTLLACFQCHRLVGAVCMFAQEAASTGLA